MSQLADKYYTVEEYLALEEKADRKSEYYDGKIYLMSGGSSNHSRISVNTVIELGIALRGTQCEVFNRDMRILIADEELYTYPDAAVVYGEAEFAPGRDDSLTNPVLLVEVLSPSTLNYDRGEKFRFYRSIESLQIYLVIDQIEMYVEYHQKITDKTWQLKAYTSPDQVIELPAIGVNITVGRLYERVKFPARKPKRKRSREKIVPHPTIEN
jgi:Uma2 family endonuclease